MSWWNPFDWIEWLSEKISWAFDKVGDGLETAFDAVGLDFVGDAADWLNDRIGEKIQATIDRAVDYTKSLPDNLGRTAEDLFNEEIYNNFGTWLARNALNALELAGIPAAVETIADIIKFETRGLDDREMALARSVFGDSINLDLVRIDNYSAVPYFTERAYTTFHTINTWGDLKDDVLIHELTHVWQFENVGADYIPGAIDAQNGEGYDYGGVNTLTYGVSQGWRLDGFNYEQQGQILQDYYKLIETGIATGYYSQDLAVYAYYVKQASTLSQSELSHVTAGVGNDIVVGDEWSNYLAGYDGNDRIYGGVSDDYLVGGNGDDLLDGGIGYDVAAYYSDYYNYQVSFDYYGNVVVNGVEGLDTLQSIEQINFNYGVYKIYTGDSTDNTFFAEYYSASLLYGGNGNDTLVGGIGNDTIVGGNDYDIAAYYYDYYNYNVSFNSNGDIVVTGFEGTDLLQGIEQINFANYGIYKIYTGDSNDNFFNATGFSYHNFVAGDYYYASLLNGEGGNDAGYSNDNFVTADYYYASLINGEGGNDTGYSDITVDYYYASFLNGGGGNDFLVGGTGNDTIVGGLDNDYLDGGLGADNLAGGSGDDTYAVDASDIVTELAGEGNDTVYSSASYTLGANLENLFLIDIDVAAIKGTGNNLDNYIYGSAADNSLDGRSGNDEIDGQIGNDKLNGGNGNDRLRGSAGSDVLIGGAGNDILLGGNNNDTLFGGDANNGRNSIDTLTGGNGNDSFVLANSIITFYDNNNSSTAGIGDYARISDFDSNEDKIVLQGSASQYLLNSSPISGVAGTALYLDTDTSSTFNSTDELIAIIQGSTGLKLTDTYFVYE